MAGLQPTPTETASGLRTAEVTPTLEASPQVKGLTGPAASPTPEALDAAPPAATAEVTDNYASEPAVQALRPGLPPVRVVEAALAMLTVMLGLGAWFNRRNA
jgi:hypothetical protein